LLLLVVAVVVQEMYSLVGQPVAVVVVLHIAITLLLHRVIHTRLLWALVRREH
jgi:hypothetical protein